MASVPASFQELIQDLGQVRANALRNDYWSKDNGAPFDGALRPLIGNPAIAQGWSPREREYVFALASYAEVAGIPFSDNPFARGFPAKVTVDAQHPIYRAFLEYRIGTGLPYAQS